MSFLDYMLFNSVFGKKSSNSSRNSGSSNYSSRRYTYDDYLEDHNIDTGGCHDCFCDDDF